MIGREAKQGVGCEAELCMERRGDREGPEWATVQQDCENKRGETPVQRKCPLGHRVLGRLCLAYTSDNEQVIASGAEARKYETRKRTGLDCGDPESLWPPLGEAEGHWWRASP